MKIGIMQPYFFPYLGYWQLMGSVDTFVILDDVNYIKRGYINKNFILINGESHMFNISLVKPSQNKLISETYLSFPTEERIDLLKTFEMAYHKAPYFDDVFRVLECAINYPENNLVSFLKNSIILTRDYLGMNTNITLSSNIEKDNSKKGQDRIIEINQNLGADIYINAIGGMDIYNKNIFKKNGIDLYFLKMRFCEYKQFNNTFIPNLSIIDVMMFNSRDKISQMLMEYDFV